MCSQGDFREASETTMNGVHATFVPVGSNQGAKMLHFPRRVISVRWGENPARQADRYGIIYPQTPPVFCPRVLTGMQNDSMVSSMILYGGHGPEFKDWACLAASHHADEANGPPERNVLTGGTKSGVRRIQVKNDQGCMGEHVSGALERGMKAKARWSISAFIVFWRTIVLMNTA